MPSAHICQQASEDYLKTIYKLSEVETPVSTSRIAAAQLVKPASVTSMIQKLSKLGLLKYEKHQGVSLTESGRAKALMIVRRHRLVELYLTEALSYSWDEVHEEAERLEHVVSQRLARRLADALGDPHFDPHGEPIPTETGDVPWVVSWPLSASSVGGRVIVAGVDIDNNQELLRYLADLGIKPGVDLLVVSSAPFDGPITVEVNGEERVVGNKAAKHILVIPDDES